MTVLLVLAKAPVPGRVKTRLCPPLRPVEAAELAAAALLDTLDAVRAVPDTTPVLAHAGDPAGAVRGTELRRTLAGWTLLPQRGQGLADRLAAAHADAAAAFPGRPVLQLGMDTPQADPGLLGAAVAVLDGAAAVLGPATDGGWWALGLRDPAAATALRRVPMSTALTGRLTRAALRGGGVEAVTLPELSDVDDWATARRVAEDAPAGRFAATVRRLAARQTDDAATAGRPGGADAAWPVGAGEPR
ncbi:TIGR04282 family arsenosugar biosynthesis glycosyltransferase [Micromonospora auratinigra]|uniref:Glycosyltransferase involved in cell wall biogenesis n=1 Tax=Micromonospora auratinigra TaxID=261654 RepID=A0A1A9A8P2_9ACTN|nr:DUF2064 domain-containing protein [Micromonospora auratinigra]SBT52851.1 hypothetical protein GA0070611_5826 [Micromonospora auratinigra]